MRLAYTTQSQAQAIADRIYADMLAAGALEPNTTSWATPTRDLDENGQPLSPLWFVAVDERCRPFLDASEIAQIPEWQAPPNALI